MKKVVFGFVCVLCFSVMLYNISGENRKIIINDTGDFKESFNSPDNIYLARKIGEKTNAKEVAVVGDEKGIAVGISLEKGTKNRSTIKKIAEEILREKYPDASIKVEVQTAKTEEILGLAENIEKGESGKSLKKNMEKLFTP